MECLINIEPLTLFLIIVASIASIPIAITVGLVAIYIVCLVLFLIGMIIYASFLCIWAGIKYIYDYCCK